MQKEDVLKMDLAGLLRKLESSQDGLTDTEAAKRLVAYGPNTMRTKGVNALAVLGRQFKSSLIYILIIASVISFSINDYSDGAVILVILVLNTGIGFLQEYKSERIVEKLSRFITNQVRVKRAGTMELLDESTVVPGDIVVLHEGDIVPADMRLLAAEDLQVNESQLTGESIPQLKKPTDSRLEMEGALVFAGSVVENGMGVGLVYATGNHTQLGNIATLSTETKKETQYEKSLQSFSSFLMKVVILGLVLIFLFKLFLTGGASNWVGLLLFILAMAVAIVPEVLPVIATVSLSSGALKLAKKHVVVKRLSSMEDLGNINLLCTDKTGTITENKMTVKGIVSPDIELFQKFAYAVITPLKGRKRRTQNSYDDAFIQYVPKALKKEAERLSIVTELPFDPDDKRRRVVLADASRKSQYLVVIGAPEVLLDLCRPKEMSTYARDISREGSEGLHHLAIAYKEVSYTPGFDLLKNERGLAFLGYVSLYDPLRPTAKKTIQLARKLGVEIKILSGDRKEVAEYIGRQVGLVKAGCQVYLGSELEGLSEGEFRKAVNSCNVFARVSPTQKFNIIKALKEKYVVAYQGDGINDAPALKQADVAIAVNTATDVAKENADIVILNSSLEVLINGIKYGRSIFVNINKYIKLTMVSNFGNFIALGVLYLISVNLPLLPIQVLLTSVMTDIPFITIYSDTVSEKEVVRPEKHDMRSLGLISLILGIPTALFELFYFMLVRTQPQRMEQTSLFIFFSLIALVVFYVVRNKAHFWAARAPSKLLTVSFVLACACIVGMTYVPVFQESFSFVSLPVSSLAVILLLTVLYFVAADFINVWYHTAVTKKA